MTSVNTSNNTTSTTNYSKSPPEKKSEFAFIVKLNGLNPSADTFTSIMKNNQTNSNPETAALKNPERVAKVADQNLVLFGVGNGKNTKDNDDKKKDFSNQLISQNAQKMRNQISTFMA